ncbi:P22 phage major capsid protein family protein [Comamonas sp. Y6]|uniref:P22 phage major capsid protein family protein n=1 Tax=Comamonas resistens TaxID=3046670 RepID=A0ABY8SY53_9BURK|nr:P22 phage major capsid protein family protein [Comamonas resistens]MDL5036841.1 P22 phage major capsid protein family protein [Comamonas resistens]WHS67151.1 P22 phage major capsid protein family protein [Comamonas resistens]
MATSNTLTGVIPTLYEALNIVSREMVGFIPAVRRDTNVARAAVGQTVRSPIGVAGDLEDITPGVNPQASGGTTVDYTDVQITASKAAPILWSGEEQRGVGHTGTLNDILRDQFADGMRKLVNAIENDIWMAAYKASSRAYGTAGTTPFGTAGDLSDFAGIARILDENGAPVIDRQLVLGHAAMGNLRGKQSVLFKVNEAGSSDMLRDGMTDRVQNFALRHSHPIGVHTKGTGASYVTDVLDAIGSRSIAVDTGTGTVLAGDVVSFAADSANKYVVNTGITAPGTLVLGKPGLRVAIPDGNGLTVGNNYTPNVAFHRGAIVLATRAPALPEGGDSADDRTVITDPLTGLSFEVSVYRQYRQVKYEIAMAWGVGTPNGAHIATLIG